MTSTWPFLCNKRVKVSGRNQERLGGRVGDGKTILHRAPGEEQRQPVLEAWERMRGPFLSEGRARPSRPAELARAGRPWREHMEILF